MTPKRPYRKRNKISPSSYHQGGGEFRNIAIPNLLHKRLAHIAIDFDISMSEIISTLADEFCTKVENGVFNTGVEAIDKPPTVESAPN